MQTAIVKSGTEMRHNPKPSPYKVIDVDTHFSEPPDLWTSRVSGKWKDLVPHQVGDEETGRKWVMNGGKDVLSANAGASSVVYPDGSKANFWDWDIAKGVHVSKVHPASYDPQARVAFMDQIGVWAQVLYPNIAGFGAHKLMRLEKELSRVIVSTYNDAMAEMQASTGRLFGMALVPFWDVKMAVEEVRRAAKMGLRGVAMCSEPHASGFPDLLDRHWDPLWEVCSEYKLPINFHVGSSEFGMEAFMKGVWPSLDSMRKYVVGCVQIEMHNGRILTNLLTSDLLVRFPETKWVSVESGIGWIPFVLERLNYQLKETTADGRGFGQPLPSELFRRQCYGCFWFEEAGPSRTLTDVGIDNVLFETDFPHPTCLYPSAVEHAMKVLSPWGEEAQRKILQDNAAKLYNIPV